MLRMLTELDDGKYWLWVWLFICYDYNIIQKKFIGNEIVGIREIFGPRGRAIGAVSGGVDITVAEKLMHEAIGDRYHR